MRIKICLAALAATAAPPAFAAEDGGDAAGADEIIVTGLRLATPAAETGTSVDIITADEIELRAYQFALDAVAAAPGVTVNQTGVFGGVTTVRIRGASSDQTLVLLDGVPLGDPTAVGGAYDFSILDAADIERIEILKGPQSTLWGSDAIGGVVNIITKEAPDGFGARLFAEGGSYKTYRGGAAVYGGGPAGDFRVSATGLSSDGISKADAADGNGEADDYQSYSFAGRGGVNLGRGFRLGAHARYQVGDTEIDGFPPPNFTLADSSDSSRTEQLSGAIDLYAPFFDDRFENTALIGYADIQRTGNFGGFAAEDNGDRLVLRYQGSATISPRARVAFGAEREELEANGDETSINAVFGLAEVKPLPGVTLSAGVRHDDHSTFGGETTARAAIAWAVADYLTLRGSWGEGFKAPTIFQLTQSFGVLPPNGDLQPETSEAFDVGADLTGLDGAARLSVVYFNRDTENEIIFAPNSRYENLERTEAQGVETALDLALTDRLSLALAHAYIDAEDAVTGERQIRIPRHSGDARLAWRNGRFEAAASLRYNGAETEGPFGSDVEEWIRVDLSAAFQVSEVVEVYGRVENLFDEEYQQVSGYGTPGLSAYGGVRLTF